MSAAPLFPQNVNFFSEVIRLLRQFAYITFGGAESVVPRTSNDPEPTTYVRTESENL